MRQIKSESGVKTAPSSQATDLQCGEVSWDTIADCRHCAIRQQALFAALRGPDFEHLFLPIRSAIVPAGTELYRQDSPGDAVYTVRNGIVKLVMRSPSDGARIVRLLGRGAAAGLEALTHGLYWHTAVSIRESDVCRVPLGVFDALEARSVQLADRVVSQWEQQLNCADRWLAELNVGPVSQRVQRLLGVLAEASRVGPAITSSCRRWPIWPRSSASPGSRSAGPSPS